MSSFEVINENCIRKIDNQGIEWIVPVDENNNDYKEYLASLKKKK